MTQDPFYNPGFRNVHRRIKASRREVPTMEFHNEPGVFYVRHGRSGDGYAVSGPFPLDDARFELATPTSCSQEMVTANH